MSSYVESPTRADTAAGAIAQFLRVKTPGAIAAAGATDVSIGTMEYPCLAAGPCTVRLRSAQGTRKMVASEAITAGNSVYAAASGKIAASGTVIEGVAMESAANNNDVIEVMPIVNVDLVAAGGITLPTVTFNGATGANEIVVPTNLADALSIEDSAGDLVVVATTTGSQSITITPATTVTGLITSNGGLTISGNVDLTFSGTTGQPEIVLTNNLADALSIKDGTGDLMVFTTTTGALAIASGAAWTHTGNVTLSGAVDLIFSGTTGQPEIVVPDNVADALSIKDGTGGSDLMTFVTTNSAERVNIAAMMRNKATTTAVAAAGSDHTDAAALPLGNICHISSDGAAKGVMLPTGGLGDWMFIINDSGTAAELYAAVGGTVNGLAANASVVIPASKGVWCQCTAADTWIVFDLPAKASAS